MSRFAAIACLLLTAPGARAVDPLPPPRADGFSEDVERGVGRFDAPALHIDRLDVRSGARGSVRLAAFLADLGDAPESAPAVTVRIGALFEATVPSSDLRRTGSGFASRTHGARVRVDYVRGLVRARFTGVPVQDAGSEDGRVDTTIELSVGDRDVSLPTVVRVRPPRRR